MIDYKNVMVVENKNNYLRIFLLYERLLLRIVLFEKIVAMISPISWKFLLKAFFLHKNCC